ncbi:MAG: riboflavin kinase [Alistipes sp.]|nr:riboflavin kinase [Alistipes sp.]
MVIKGEVIHGAQLGRKMGFPTANIDARDIKVDNGVYYSQVQLDGRLYNAMSNIGLRPSVDGQTRLLETHIFGFAGDLYGRVIEVDLRLKIRDERRFASIEELQRQLERDAALCNPEL